MGIGGVALAWLLQREGLLAKPVKPGLKAARHNLLPKQPHYAPRAKAMISCFMQGGPSQMDICDPKPQLDEWAGRDFPEKIKYDNAAQASSKVLPSPWKFKKHGQCSMDFSELVPGFGEIADELCLIRSMHTGVNNHGQSIHAMNSGRITKGRPALGSWLTYGLGSENQNLPAYMVLRDPANLPVEGVLNWSAGWLPSLYQGTVVRASSPRILNLEPPPHLRGKPQENFLEFLGELNRDGKSAGELDLEARIASFELAARMQTAAADVMNISSESEATRKMYGIDQEATKDFGTRCLIARRLVERGVRFVQLFTKNQYWDHHGDIKNSLPASCKKIDRPIAALVKDLRGRGLLDSTVVHWGGEMGRLPVVQNEKNPGRDHNPSAALVAQSVQCAADGAQEIGHHVRAAETETRSKIRRLRGQIQLDAVKIVLLKVFADNCQFQLAHLGYSEVESAPSTAYRIIAVLGLVCHVADQPLRVLALKSANSGFGNRGLSNDPFESWVSFIR